MSISYFDIMLSGGASNADPDLSLGGTISSTKLTGQTITLLGGDFTGISIVDGSGVETAGILDYNNTAKTLKFKKFGGADPTTEQTAYFTGDGYYVVGNFEGDQMITVYCTFASLPASQQQKTIDTVTNISQNLFNNVTEQESLGGIVKYRHLYIKNTYSSQILVTLFIGKQFTGLDYLEIGAAQLISGVTDELLTNDETAPQNVTFINPTLESDGLSFLINVGESCGFYIKRTVTPITDISTPSDIGILKFSVGI